MRIAKAYKFEGQSISYCALVLWASIQLPTVTFQYIVACISIGPGVLCIDSWWRLGNLLNKIEKSENHAMIHWSQSWHNVIIIVRANSGTWTSFACCWKINWGQTQRKHCILNPFYFLLNEVFCADGCLLDQLIAQVTLLRWNWWEILTVAHIGD